MHTHTPSKWLQSFFVKSILQKVVRFYRGRRRNPSRLPLTEIVNGISKIAAVLFAGTVLWQ